VKVLRNPDVKKAWNEQGAEPLIMSPAEFDKYLRQDIAKWAKIVKISGASSVQ
jgi:tripartite-type tricarboxylate transporter receptor subunit TctC